MIKIVYFLNLKYIALCMHVPGMCGLHACMYMYIYIMYISNIKALCVH